MVRRNNSTKVRFRLMLTLILSGSLTAIPGLSSSATTQDRRQDLSVPIPHGSAANHEGGVQQTAGTGYGNVGMSFEENRGQTDEQVKFVARGAGYTLFLTPAEAVFVLASSQNSAQSADSSNSSRKTLGQSEAVPNSTVPAAPSAVIRMKLAGANANPSVSGFEELEGKVNYFIGNDRARWHAEIPTFGRVKYSEVYDGVDMVYYGNQQQLEYDFVVSPGTDYRQIAIGFEGANKVELDTLTGDLLLQVGEHRLRQHKPVVYQELNGARSEVESSYLIRGENSIGFELGTYDSSKPVIIDPVLAYSTYLGGGLEDKGRGIAVDSSGCAYITGSTTSLEFPTTIPGAGGGGSDVFVTKLNAAGTAPIYSTYFGGGNGDSGSDIAVDSSGHAYVTGSTSSLLFPTTSGALDSDLNGSSDGFVTKLNATGSGLLYSTYFGGTGIDGPSSLAIDLSGNAYITGSTLSMDLPTANALQGAYGGDGDCFVMKLNAAGSALLYSTYLGTPGSDAGFGISVDSSGNAYVVGDTNSNAFPLVNAFDNTYNGGLLDVFVTKLNPAGSALIYSTYLGGAGIDEGIAIALDLAGNAYVAGATDSANFPMRNPRQSLYLGNTDGFVTKLNSLGSALIYSTYLGGSQLDFGIGIAADAAGNCYVTGRTASVNFPVVNAIQTANLGFDDAFVTKYNALGSAYLYSTYVGGSQDDHGNAIATDPAGNSYITGEAFSIDFPTSANAFQSTNSGGFDAFISKIGDYSISGRVIDASGNGIESATVTLSGSNSDVTTTDAAGHFAFLDTTLNGNFTVSSSKTDYTFSPASFTVNNLSTNQELFFVGSAPTPTPTPTPTATPTATPTPIPTATPATVQFSAPSFGVEENAGEFQIIVTRSGDTSRPVSIDYATTDGTANERSDYNTTIGRLRFAAGDTAVSFNVFITDDVFAEGNETINVTLANPSSGAQIAGSASAVLTIVDNDLANGTANPINDTQFFVRQHYIDFFGRAPDPSGLTFWSNNIETCGANSSCRGDKRVDTSAAFFLSIEFRQTGFLVERIYQSAFNRFPSYREFIRDTPEIGRGVVVGQGSWQAQLDANQVEFAADFVMRPDFLAIYGGLSNAQYVDALNANTGGSLSVADQAALVAGLNAATETRPTVLAKAAENASFSQREFNRAFVLMQYFGYLRRNPNDPPDADFSGYNFWLAKLNSFSGDFRNADMVKAFINATEYRGRFGQP